MNKGDKIKVEYEGRFEDGEVFDSSEKHGQPLEVEVGVTPLVKGFTDALLSMKKGEEKEITLKPEEAYGDVNSQLVQKIPKDKFPQEPEVKKGMVLGLNGPDGNQFPAVVADVSDKEVTLDLNHPLAGKTLIFKLKILE